MSQFQTQCGACGKTLVFASEQQGQSGPCAYCGQIVVALPPADQTAPQAAMDFQPMTSQPAMAHGAMPQTHAAPVGFWVQGRVIGALLIVAGFLGTLVAAWSLYEFGATLKLFIACPALGLWGVALMVLPGAPVSLSDTRAGLVAKDYFLKAAPMAHKIAWGLAMAVGVVIGLAMLF